MNDLLRRRLPAASSLLALFAAAWLTAGMASTMAGILVRPMPRTDLSAPGEGAAAQLRPAPAPALDDARLWSLLGIEPPVGDPSGAAGADVPPPSCADPAADPAPSVLPLTLVGGVVGNLPRSALVTLADPTTHERRTLGVGERIGEAEVLGLRRLAVGNDLTGNGFKLVAILCNRGSKEYVEIVPAHSEPASPAPSARPVPGRPTVNGIRELGSDRYEVDRAVIDGILGDPVRLSEARAVPFVEGGVVRGFRVVSIAPGSLYAGMGVENGDVILRVNGYEIDSAGKVLEIYQKLREASRVTLDLQRGGQAIRKEYRITSG
jgi:general secretion pathway protein C